MNKNYLCIDFKSELSPAQMLDHLREAFPTANWHGSDTDTQGPTLSSLPRTGPQLKIFFEENKHRFCANFAAMGLQGLELEQYKAEFLAFVRGQVLPAIHSIEYKTFMASLPLTPQKP